MEILLEAFREYLPLLSYAVIRGLVIFIMSLGSVYIFGRMLDLIHSYKSKNSVALLIMILTSYWSVLMYDMNIIVHAWEVYWRAFIYTSIASIFYVLIGFDLFDRFNTWCDKKFSGKKK
jgi:hypothetical protein